MLTANEIRQAYLDFFASRGHLILPSAPLVPENDPSILWINAGMTPFKPYFDGRKTPPRKRIVTSQKCIRTNDIENVGKTDRHHTFFEMLGNFSFGDYFKEETIAWSWGFVTEVLNLEKDRLLITIYQDDDEAFAIWHQKVGLPEERIVRKGKKDNFWEIGTGPCGPCSEIHYDRGSDYGSERFLEIWNLVFTQYDRNEAGEYLPLPNKNIDTGMGLERVASIIQGVDSNFETDLFMPLLDFLAQDTGIKYRKDRDSVTAFRVIADHIRGITFAIFDGALPSNEGRGYVIRRILRRAVRYGGKLGYHEPFLYRLVPVVIEIMRDVYPELGNKKSDIQDIIRSEEERFLQTLNQGLQIINEMVAKLQRDKQAVLSGRDAFKLYDTYGFPLDLTRDVLEENGFAVDENGFTKEMEEQRERARQAREDIGFSGSDRNNLYGKLRNRVVKTVFTGYDTLRDEGRIIAILRQEEEVDLLKAGEKGEIILDVTPFYAESGGQVGDRGILSSGDNLARVYDTRKKAELTVHLVEVKDGEFRTGQIVQTSVSPDIRKATARNHSATHLLHRSLKEILGEHVNQAGSLVTSDRLRFDFNHFSALEDDQIAEIEQKVNQAILDNLPVRVIETSLARAREMGALSLFEEKYGEEVRVVSMGDFSQELCGGTHVNSTGEIGLFKIISEGSVAAGIRRIEAITGTGLLNYVSQQIKLINQASDRLKTGPDNLLNRLDDLFDQQRELEREVDSLRDRLLKSQVDDLVKGVEIINDLKLLTVELKDMDNEALLRLADLLKERLATAIIILASTLNGKVIFVAMVTPDLVKKGYHAGRIVSKIAKITGGGGGGRPDMAQAGGQKIEKTGEALTEAKNIILNY